jgi:hypothetical protein
MGVVAWTIFPVQNHLWGELNVRLGLSYSASWWKLACFETKRGPSWAPWNDGQNVCRHGTAHIDKSTDIAKRGNSHSKLLSKLSALL